MKLLALDCSTEACSVALYQCDAKGTGALLEERQVLAAREHTQRLLPMVAELLSAAQLSISQIDAIAFGRGPGSFTGLRIAIGAAQGLAFGADLPVVPVSSLAALAQTAVDTGKLQVTTDEIVVAAIDARMDELYWAPFRVECGLAVGIAAELLQAPEAVRLPGLVSIAGAGSGWRYAERIPQSSKIQHIAVDVLPSAGAVARLAAVQWQQGRYCRADEAQPVYLRDEVAWQQTAPPA